MEYPIVISSYLFMGFVVLKCKPSNFETEPVNARVKIYTKLKLLTLLHIKPLHFHVHKRRHSFRSLTYPKVYRTIYVCCSYISVRHGIIYVNPRPLIPKEVWTTEKHRWEYKAVNRQLLNLTFSHFHTMAPGGRGDAGRVSRLFCASSLSCASYISWCPCF